jgi:hypothetical protein
MIQSGGTSIFNYKNESIGVYDKCKLISIYPYQTFQIVTPSKVTYDFEKLAGGPDGVFLIKSISDRNGNTLSFTNELGFNNYPRLKSVSDPAGRTLNFVYKPLFNWLIEVNLSGVGAFNGRSKQLLTVTLPLPIAQPTS